jgi:hypothetical protein
VPASGRAEGESTRVAVLCTASGVSGSASGAIARAAAEATLQAGADPVPPDEVARAVRAAKGDVATCGTNAACAAAACAAVKADVLLAARVSEAGKSWTIEMRLREGRRGLLRGQAVETVPRDERAAREAVARLAHRLVQQLIYPGAHLMPAGAPLASPTPKATAPTDETSNAASPARTTSTLPAERTAAVATSSAGTAPTTSLRTAETATPARESAGKADVGLIARDRPPSQPAPSSRRRWSVMLAGGGAALLASGAAVGALAWSESNGASASLARGDIGRFAVGRQSARTLGWTAAGLGGAGAAALAAGAWLSFGGGSSRVSLGVEPGVAGGRVAVAF